MADTRNDHHFDFAFDRRYRLVGRALGVTPSSAIVKVGAEHLTARFGPWTVRTPLANIAETTLSGPYSLVRTIGPAHLSFADRGLTFATNPDRGVCLSFVDPVSGIEPFGFLRHPGLTVTVADPAGLVAAIEQATSDQEQSSTDAAPLTSVPEQRIEELEEERAEQAAEDQLHLMSASDLRSLADERGVAHTSRMKKAELVDLLEADLATDLVEVMDEVMEDHTG